MLRYRITTTAPDEAEQTWVLLPDRPSAIMQAEELSNRKKALHVRVYREEPGAEPQLDVDLPPRGVGK